MKPRTLALMSAITLFAVLAVPVLPAAQELQGGNGVNNAAAGTQNPVPLINEPLLPDTANPGGAGFTLTVNGTGFVSGSVVQWNGAPRTTKFVSSAKLTASILSSDIAKVGTASVTVLNPSPGGGTSNVVFFPIALPLYPEFRESAFGAWSAPPISAVTSDFNRDGKLDLAVVNQNSNSISVLLGNGNGTFQAAVSHGAGSFPYEVAVGDFNGDGKPDLVVTNLDSNNDVHVLLGNGDGTFQVAVTYGVGSSPSGVAAADFNGDGKLDMVVANSASNDVSVLLGNGDGTFRPAVTYAAGPGPSAVVVGDFNGDGKLDVAVANESGGNISVLLGNGDGTFRAAVMYGVGSGPVAVAVGDFNGDGKLDLAVANNFSNDVSILLGNGNGAFQAAVDYNTGAGPNSVEVGDFNEDGKLDLVIADASSNQVTNQVTVLLGNGDGTFQPAIPYAAGSQAVTAVPGDFNGDGRLDLAIADGGSLAVDILLQATTVSVSPLSLNFGNQLIGITSPAKDVTLTNTDGITLAISSIAVTGTNATDFSQTNTCGSGLAPGAKCTIRVAFTPSGKGPRTASVKITDTAVNSPQSIALSGTGVVSGSNATLSASSLTFTTRLVGTTSLAQSVTLSNYGANTLSITKIGFTGSDPDDFSQTNSCGSSVAPGASCTISVTFRPTQRGSRTAMLSIADNAPGSPQTVSLAGTGTVVELNPASLDFVSSGTRNTTLTNTGSTTLNIIGITITNSTYYSQTNTCGSTVAAGKSCTISVTFRKPGARCQCISSVSIGDDGGGSPQQVPLSGISLK